MKLFVALVLVFISHNLLADKDIWKFDPQHTSIGFEVGHLGISKIRGLMKLDSGELKINSNDISSAEFQVKIDARSLNTMVEARDNHVKSKDFLETETFPFITFKSSKVTEDKENNKIYIDGELTIKNKTKSVRLTADPVSEEIDIGKGATRGIVASTIINRFDFDVNYGKDKNLIDKIVNGGIARDITISLSTELTKQEVGKPKK